MLTPGFYARADTRTPVRIAIISMACNLALNLVLFGTELAMSARAVDRDRCAWINVGLLYWTLRKRGHFAADARLKRRAHPPALAARRWRRCCCAFEPFSIRIERLADPRVGGLSCWSGRRALLFRLRLPVRAHFAWRDLRPRFAAAART